MTYLNIVLDVAATDDGIMSNLAAPADHRALDLQGAPHDSAHLASYVIRETLSVLKSTHQGQTNVVPVCVDPTGTIA